MRMSFSFPQKHKLVAVLTENRQVDKFIIITTILPFPHDSEICPDGMQNVVTNLMTHLIEICGAIGRRTDNGQRVGL
jgi:hypothetical protein